MLPRLGNFVRSITIIIICLDLEGDVPVSFPDEGKGNEERSKMILGTSNCLPLALQLKYFFLPTIAFGSIISNTLNSMMASSGTLMLKEASSDQVGLNPLFGTCPWSWWQWTVYWLMIFDDQWSLIITKIRVPLTALDYQDWASQGWPRTRIFTKGWIMSPACWWSYSWVWSSTIYSKSCSTIYYAGDHIVTTRVWSSTIYSTSEVKSRFANLPADRKSLEDVGPRWVGCWGGSPGIDI